MTSRARLSGGALELGEGHVCRQALGQDLQGLRIELGADEAVSEGTHAQSPRLSTAARLGWVNGGALERFEAAIRLERLGELDDARHVLAAIREVVVIHAAREATRALERGEGETRAAWLWPMCRCCVNGSVDAAAVPRARAHIRFPTVAFDANMVASFAAPSAPS